MLSSVLIIGVGNEFRSDDAAGVLIARAIEEKKLPDVLVIEGSGEGAALMEAWSEADNVFLIDAVSSGAVPGTVHRVDARIKPLPKELVLFSTHAFGVAQAVELARSMNTLPPKLVLFGVEGKNFSSGTNLSFEVLAVVQRITQMLLDEISSVVKKE
ncbi:MAG: hydrogenase maturation protease [Bacteroidota bacterium]